MLGVNTGKGDYIMKCPACGRWMLVGRNHFECSNILCDYEEELEDSEMIRMLILELRRVIPIGYQSTIVKSPPSLGKLFCLSAW